MSAPPSYNIGGGSPLNGDALMKPSSSPSRSMLLNDSVSNNRSSPSLNSVNGQHANNNSSSSMSSSEMGKKTLKSNVVKSLLNRSSSGSNLMSRRQFSGSTSSFNSGSLGNSGYIADDASESSLDSPKSSRRLHGGSMTENDVDKSLWTIRALKENPEIADIYERIKPIHRCISLGQHYAYEETLLKDDPLIGGDTMLQLILQHLQYEGLLSSRKSLESESNVKYPDYAFNESRLVTLIRTALKDSERIYSLTLDERQKDSQQLLEEHLALMGLLYEEINDSSEDVNIYDEPEDSNIIYSEEKETKGDSGSSATQSSTSTGSLANSTASLTSGANTSSSSLPSSPSLMNNNSNNSLSSSSNMSSGGAAGINGNNSSGNNSGSGSSSSNSIIHNARETTTEIDTALSGATETRSVRRGVEKDCHPHSAACSQRTKDMDQPIIFGIQRQTHSKHQIIFGDTQTRQSIFSQSYFTNIKQQGKREIKIKIKINIYIIKGIGVEDEDDDKKSKVVFTTAAPEPKVPKNIWSQNLDIFDVEEEEVARQLTLIDFEIFSSIKPSELLNQSWNKPKLRHRSPNVLTLITRFNEISSWTASLILSNDKVKDRARNMAKIIKIAEYLMRPLNNFNTSMAILSGLNAASVHRLRFTKEEMPKHIQQIWADLQAQLSSNQSYKVYRDLLSKANPPCLPYLGVCLTDLTFIEDGNPDQIKGFINFSKRKLIYNAISTVQSFQNTRYNLHPVYQISKLLRNLKPRLDEDDLYRRSLCTKSNQSQQQQQQQPHQSSIWQQLKPTVNFQYIKDNQVELQENAKKRNTLVDIQSIVAKYDEYRVVKREIDAVRKQKNDVAAAVKQKSLSKEERQALIDQGKQVKDRLAEMEISHDTLFNELTSEALKIPNNTHPDSPIGPEDKAVTVLNVGKIPEFNDGFQPKDHVELGESLGLLKPASHTTGHKYYYFTRDAAMLEMALSYWAFSTMQLKYGFTPIITPDVVHPALAEACGFQPRSEATQLYWMRDHELCLTATAEIPMAGIHSNSVLDQAELPLKMVGYSHCFRAETGRGVINKGIYRVHQFSKVEMFVISTPEQSESILKELLDIQIEMFSSLELPFRVLDMPTEDLGAPAYRKYDIEVWIPSRNGYGEISSASSCTDYQSKRLNIKYKHNNNNNTDNQSFAHTLNATACAIPRIILAILENNQQPDGSVIIPKILRPLMGGKDRILPLSKNNNNNNNNTSSSEIVSSEYSIKDINILGGQLKILSGEVQFDQDIYKLQSYTCSNFNCSGYTPPACPPCDYTINNPLGCGVSNCGSCQPSTRACGPIDWVPLSVNQWQSGYLKTLSTETNNAFYNFYADPNKCVGYKVSLRIHQGSALLYASFEAFHPDFDSASRYIFSEISEQTITFCPNDMIITNQEYTNVFPYGTIFIAIQSSVNTQVDLIFDLIIEEIDNIKQVETITNPCKEVVSGVECVEDGLLYNQPVSFPGKTYSYTFEGCKNITISSMVVDVDFDLYVTINDPNISTSNYLYSSTIAFDDIITINVCTEKGKSNTTIFVFLAFSDAGNPSGYTNFFVSSYGTYRLHSISDNPTRSGTWSLAATSRLKIDDHWLGCYNYEVGCELFFPSFPRQYGNPLNPTPGIFLTPGLSLVQFKHIAVNETDNPPKPNTYQFALILSTFFNGAEIEFNPIPKNITLFFLDTLLYANGEKISESYTLITNQTQPACDFKQFNVINMQQDNILDTISITTNPNSVQSYRYLYDMLVYRDNYYGCSSLAQQLIHFNTTYKMINSTRCPLEDKKQFGTNPCCSLSAMFGSVCTPTLQNISYTQFMNIDNPMVESQCQLPDCAESVLTDFANSIVQNQYNPCVADPRDEHNAMDILYQTIQDCHRLHTEAFYCMVDSDCPKAYGNGSFCNPRNNECQMSPIEIDKHFIQCVLDNTPKEISSILTLSLNSTDPLYIREQFMTDQCYSQFNEVMYTKNSVTYTTLDVNYSYRCYYPPAGFDFSAPVLFDTCLQGVTNYFWRSLVLTPESCTSNVRCDWLGDQGTLATQNTSMVEQVCAENTPTHFCGDCIDPMMNCYSNLTITNPTTCNDTFVCYQNYPGVLGVKTSSYVNIPNEYFHQTTDPSHCSNYGYCNGTCGTQCLGQTTCNIVHEGLFLCPNISGVVPLSQYLSYEYGKTYCSYNSSVSQSTCSAQGGTYIVCSSLTEQECNTCLVGSPNCACYVSKIECQNQQQCEGPDQGYCSDEFYFSISPLYYPRYAPKCVYNWTISPDYQNSYPQCTFGYENASPLGCFSFNYTMLSDPNACVQSGGSVWTRSKTKSECLSKYGCLGYEMTDSFAPPGTKRFNTKNQQDCLAAGEEWTNLFTWSPSKWSPATPVRLKWLPASKQVTTFTHYGSTFNFLKFMQALIQATQQRLSEIYRSELLCLISNTKSTLESISCTCAGGSGQCFPEQETPTTSIIKPCSNSTFPVNQDGSISFTNQSITQNRCVSIGIGTIFQNQFLSKQIHALSSNFISVLSPADFSVFNEKSAVIGVVISDGVTLNFFSEGVQSFELCLPTTKHSSSKYPLIDFARLVDDQDGIVEPFECDIQINGTNFCCNIANPPIGSSSYLLISRMDDWRSEKPKLFTKYGEGLVYTLAVFYLIICAFCLIELFYFGYIRLFADEPFRIVHVLFLFLFLFTVTRSLYFFILPSGRLTSGTNVGEYILVVLPTFLYFTSFTIVLVIWYILANIKASLANNLTTLINRMVIVINIILYLLFVIIVLVFNFNHPSRPDTCGGRLAGKYENTKVQSGVSILYAVVQCVLSLAIAVGFIYYGKKVYTALSEVQSKSPNSGKQKQKTFLMATICSIGFLIHCIFIIILVSANPSNIIFSFILLLATEIVPVVTLIIAYNQISINKSGTRSPVHLTKSTWSSSTPTHRSNSTATSTNTTFTASNIQRAVGDKIVVSRCCHMVNPCDVMMLKQKTT
ncbi:hypothetical protein PPL_11854 [Heterostelium album PN500]|uniref:serine--tRNA ligase n=1 Tax=Heterostelium pallidum (strain ATCC 26659 / Pp 5 / PN500) TaxID=670386 RepID=D3BUN3_HETP5|nr:hypothetical protein PPL_11854 [Heterostelium album PN500]EFA74821.1 hypothetical protein PPL_11854 [Heterostelium album PN500]|eukprot:XP_020426955.1 hypothetical protein PPL_11854 [Heterostelium album PN500]